MARAQPPKKNPVFPTRSLTTTVSARQRTISVLLETGVTERYCLMRRTSGEVRWVLDSFKNGAWTAHGGTLTVADVVERIPDAARDVIRWTEREVEDGVDVVEVDLFSRERRRECLARLASELGEI
jgi:hypothetical protein